MVFHNPLAERQAYPILTTATIEGPKIENDTIQYKFTSQIGTKG
jgi:PRTRC genetic system protein C